MPPVGRRNDRQTSTRRPERLREREAPPEWVAPPLDEPAAPTRVGRAMALDVGEKTVGVATTDELGLTASPRETLRRDGREWDRLAEWVGAEGVTEVVVGLPLSLNGTMGPAARLVLAFVETLRARVPVPVHTWDERLTTAEAEKVLTATQTRRAKRRQVVDQLAATLILQGYLRHRMLNPPADEP
jgi:putative Holliday junction resolvase